MEKEGDSRKLVENLFRNEYGKLISTLTRLFGTSYIELAEDVVQETLIAAIDHWTLNGVPENPTGWLVQVAKRKALNELNRSEMIRGHHNVIKTSSVDYKEEISNVFLESEIKDNQLRMIFTCCHDVLDSKSQIALTLKTLCGFGVKEVARALLSSEATVNKRLYRAKEKIRTASMPFSIPQGTDLLKRLSTVQLAMYLMFNEGYNRSAGDQLFQKDLCLEAIRLTKLLVDHFNTPDLNALLAIMCYHTARFDARLDRKGGIILFEEQDRSRWNQKLIQNGMYYFRNSIRGTQLSSYHIEARIACEHCLAGNYNETNWEIIREQYVLLSKLKPNPVIQLNLAIIQSRIAGYDASLKELSALENTPEMKDYYLLPATQANFHLKMDRFKEALAYFEKALNLNPSPVEEQFIQSKMDLCIAKLKS